MNLESKIAIIGLGYVGLPLSIEFAKYFQVLGYDNDSERVSELKRLKDKTGEANIEKMEKALTKKLKLSSNENDLNDYNIYIITVPPQLQFQKPQI